jgi:hypothetical protein
MEFVDSALANGPTDGFTVSDLRALAHSTALFHAQSGRQLVLLIDRSHFSWYVTFGVALGSAIGIFAWYPHDQAIRPDGDSPVGLSYGILAGLIIVFECLLGARKRIRSVRRLGSAVWWMRAHIWLGLLSVPLVFLHSGMDLGGVFTTWLSVVFVFVIVSGIFGLWLQQWLPRMLTGEVAEETILSQIGPVMRLHSLETARLIDDLCGLPRAPEKLAVQYLGAEELGAAAISSGRKTDRSETTEPSGRMAGTTVITRKSIERVQGVEELRRFFGTDAAPYLLHGAKSRSPLCSAAIAETRFRDLRDKLPAQAQAVVDLLERQCSRRRQLDQQSWLHLCLHSWLWVHLPLSWVLLVLTVAHAIVVWRY